MAESVILYLQLAISLFLCYAVAGLVWSVIIICVRSRRRILARRERSLPQNTSARTATCVSASDLMLLESKREKEGDTRAGF